MFSFFKRNKSLSKERALLQSASRVMAPDTEIAYDPYLIDKFEHDHKILLSIFKKIVDSADRGRFNEVPKLLKEFKSTFHAHLLLENVRLYIYLKHCLVNEADSLEVMLEMKNEMQAIGKAVTKFINKYSAPGSDWTYEMRTNFPKELLDVGSVLTERINSEEETLYPLYMAPSNY